MARAPGLWPREQGAYAELAFPLLSGFLLGSPSVAGVEFAVAVAAAFLINEPLSVLKGLRGERQRHEFEALARRWVAVLAVVGLAGALTGMALAPPVARRAALVPAAFAVMLVPSVVWGKPKRLGTELIMAAAFAAMLPPVALAGSGELRPAAVAGAVWLTCFWLATLGVHAIKARAKPDLGSPWTVWASPALSLFVIGAALLMARLEAAPSPAVLGVLPAAMVTLGASALRVHPRHLKRVGWSLVAGNVVTLVLLAQD